MQKPDDFKGREKHQKFLFVKDRSATRILPREGLENGKFL